MADMTLECCQSVHGLLVAKNLKIEHTPLDPHTGNNMLPTASTADAWLLVDRPAVVSALVAVLENAIQISPAGATIRFESQTHDQRLQWVVTDQGPGIAPDMLDCLFEPFATNRSNGTGLGLAIALNTIRAHRGDIQAQNLTQGGAQFTISLPSMELEAGSS
jgi:signal transduction histidine kinase